MDAGILDAGEGPDAGEPPDAGAQEDAGEPDAGGAVDAGLPDAGIADAGTEPPDAGPPDAGPPDAGPTPPNVRSAVPLFGPYGTQVHLQGEGLRGTNPSLTLAGLSAALRPDSGYDVRWSNSEVRVNYPFPAAGPMVLRSNSLSADAGVFVPDWVPYSFAPSSSDAPGLYDGDQLVESWASGPGELSAVFQGSQGVRVLTWSDTAGVVEEQQLASPALRVRELSLRTEAGLAGGAAIGFAPDGGTALYVLQVGATPAFIPTGFQRDVLSDFVASGRDGQGEFAWVHQADAGFLRIREASPAWTMDLGPIAPPVGFRGGWSGGRVLPSGALAVAWPVDRSNIFFTLSEPHFSILPAGSGTFGADEQAGGQISGYLVQNRIRTSSDGRISLRYCGGYISWVLFPFPFPVPTITGCHDAIRSAGGSWSPAPLGLETRVDALALTPGSLTVADCSSEGLRTYALAPGASSVPAERDAGEFSVWPCPEVLALEVDGAGNRLALIERGGKLHVPRKNPAAVLDPPQICTPHAFESCDGDDAVYCNAQGTGTRLRPCGDLGCNASAGRCRVVAASNLPGDLCVTPGAQDFRVESLETVVVDTSNAASCHALVPQSGGPELCLKKHANISIGFSGNGELRVVGSRPLALVATENLYVDGVITTSAGRSTNGGTGAGGGCAGCGAGGGSYGSLGGAGGRLSSGTGTGLSGPAFGAPELIPLVGGGTGGTGGAGAGGAGGTGGGALQLFSCNRLQLTSDARIEASGAGGKGGGGGVFNGQGEGGGGGGSGGAVLLEGSQVLLGTASLIAAHGGGGGGGGATASFPGGPAGEAGSSGAGECTAYGGSGGNGSAGSGGAGETGCATAPSTGGNATAAAHGAGGGGGGYGRIRINSREPVTTPSSAISPEPSFGTLGTD